jgi:hypothetical protein
VARILIDRERRMVERRIKEARFPAGKRPRLGLIDRNLVGLRIDLE